MISKSKPLFAAHLARAIAVAIAFLVASIIASIVAVEPAEAIDIKTRTSGGAHAYVMHGNSSYRVDATGDRKKDDVRVIAHECGPGWNIYDRLTIKINGQTAFSRKTYFHDANIELIQLRNGKCFFYVYLPMDNGDADVFGIYKVSGGKMKRVINGNRVLGKSYGSHRSGSIVKASRNSIWLEYNLMSYSAGPISTTVKYNYSKGSLKRASNATKLMIYPTGTCKAKKAMKLYGSPKCKSIKSTIKTGTPVRFLSVWSNGVTTSFKVKANGKTGWLKLAKSYNSPLMHKYRYSGSFYMYEPPFEGRMLAG